MSINDVTHFWIIFDTLLPSLLLSFQINLKCRQKIINPSQTRPNFYLWTTLIRVSFKITHHKHHLNKNKDFFSIKMNFLNNEICFQHRFVDFKTWQEQFIILISKNIQKLKYLFTNSYFKIIICVVVALVFSVSANWIKD